MREVMFDLVTKLGIEYMTYYRFDHSDNIDYFLGIKKHIAVSNQIQGYNTYFNGSYFGVGEFDIIRYNNDNHMAEKIELDEAPDKIRDYMLKEMI